MITEIKFYSDSSFDVSGSMETKQKRFVILSPIYFAIQKCFVTLRRNKKS